MFETRHEQVNEKDMHTDMGLDWLMAALASRDPATRRHARHALVRLGEGAVPSLIKALHDRRDQVRWEAAKTLVDIASPAAAPALVTTLRDQESGIRWLAAEALIALGPDGLEPVLQGLVAHSSSAFMREGAHHVLHELAGGPFDTLVLPVLTALDGPSPQDRAPVSANESIEALNKSCPSASVGRSSQTRPQ